jgi:RNA polymerase sigma factor (sigma-70 family)
MLYDYLRTISWHSRRDIVAAKKGELELKRVWSLQALQQYRDKETTAEFLENLGKDGEAEIRTQRKDEVADMLKQLLPKPALAMKLYFLHGMTMSKIGERMSLSESRVSQMISGAKVQLQAHYPERRYE